jgi:hypothetical protein
MGQERGCRQLLPEIYEAQSPLLKAFTYPRGTLVISKLIQTFVTFPKSRTAQLLPSQDIVSRMRTTRAAARSVDDAKPEEPVTVVAQNNPASEPIIEMTQQLEEPFNGAKDKKKKKAAKKNKKMKKVVATVDEDESNSPNEDPSEENKRKNAEVGEGKPLTLILVFIWIVSHPWRDRNTLAIPLFLLPLQLLQN